MPFNGAGVFVRLYNWTQDAAAGIKIRADRMDAETNGIATGLSTCITKDGQTTITADLPMSGFKHTGVDDANLRNEYAAEGQVQDGVLNWAVAGGTADAITANYTIALSTLVDGQLCFVRAGAANATTTPTFSPNGITARTIVKNGGVALAAGDISGAGHELELRYKLASTRWELMNPAIPALSSSLTDLSSKWTPASAAGPASLQLAEDTDNGTNKVTVKAPATLAADYNFVLPVDDGNAGEVLATDGSGNTSWQTKLATMVAGSIVQVVQTVKADTFTSSGNSYQDITGLSASITPTSNTNKILVFVQIQGDTNTNHCFLKLVRDSTDISIGNAASNRTRASTQINLLASSGAFQTTATIMYLDSPATTSATTYKVQGIVPSSGTFYINRSQTDTDLSTFARTASTITLLEVKV